MEKLLLSLVLCIVAANSLISQDLSPYHHIIKGIVRKNFKSITEHRYDRQNIEKRMVLSWNEIKDRALNFST